jgi:hypothetical protein
MDPCGDDSRPTNPVARSTRSGFFIWGNMEDKKSYYSIMPASVRYDKSLTSNAKLLFGEITALANERGYCWASNRYFSDLYGVTPQAISCWIKQLEASGYIHVKYINEGKEIKERRLYISDYNYEEIGEAGGINKLMGGYQQIVGGVSIKSEGGINKKLKVILNTNTKLNNTSIENAPSGASHAFEKPTIEEVESYCSERGDVVDPQKWYSHYEAVGWKVGKNPMKNWRAAVRTWEPKGHKVTTSQKKKTTCPKCGSDLIGDTCPKCYVPDQGSIDALRAARERMKF